MVAHVVRRYPAADTIHLVMDNLNIHCRKSLTDHFGELKGGDIWDRLSVHYTPQSRAPPRNTRLKSPHSRPALDLDEQRR
jgi:hypothetical protein